MNTAFPLTSSEIEELARLYGATSRGEFKAGAEGEVWAGENYVLTAGGEWVRPADQRFLVVIHNLFPRIVASMKAANPLTHNFIAEPRTTPGMTRREIVTAAGREPCLRCGMPAPAHVRSKDPTLTQARIFGAHGLELPHRVPAKGDLS